MDTRKQELQEALALIELLNVIHREKQTAVAALQAACDEESIIVERLRRLGTDPDAAPPDGR